MNKFFNNILNTFYYKNYIKRYKSKRYNIDIGCIEFAEVIFENCCELLIDLVSDTTLLLKSGDERLFISFKKFFEKDGKKFLIQIYKKGFVVINFENNIFSILDECDYKTITIDNKTIFYHKDDKCEGKIIVFEGEHYNIYGKSHLEKLKPFIILLDNILNASNTITKRLGVAIFATPNTPNSANTIARLNPKNKEDLEKELQKEYGALDIQSVINVLSEDLNFNVINLAGQELRLSERLKIAVLTISDKIKIPANQIGLIDAQGTKSFANGSEMRQGDFQKYQSFERLLNATFIELGKELGLTMSYEIYNKPKIDTENSIIVDTTVIKK